MKNLKKVLALGLALIMLMGMFTVVSAAETKKIASDLTDWDTVSHKDAVSLMVDLGIIKGKDTGDFDPTGNIDRASWAKMVYFAATGSEDADAFLGTNSGLNDISGNWAEAYINFLKANKYISGDNMGNYNPSANVTVAEACKMMLTVLGYDADDRGYQGTEAWSGNIMTDAKRNGLMDNVDSKMTALTPLTRENAAEIVLNALNANTVISESRRDNGESYVVSYTKSSPLGYDVFNMVKVTATMAGIDDDGFAVFEAGAIQEPYVVNGTVKTVFSAALNSKIKGSAGMGGETVNVYVTADGFKWDGTNGEITKLGTFKNVISTSVAKADTAAYKVITSGLNLVDATNRNSTSYVAPNYAANCEYYYNGEKVASNNTLLAAATPKRGTVVEFYLDDEGLISLVKAYYYTADKVEGTVGTKTLSDGTLQVKIPGLGDGLSSFVDADKVSGWQGLEDGDVVLYYVTNLTGGGKGYTIEKAETLNSKVKTFDGDRGALVLAVDGKKYRYTDQKVSYSDAAISEAIFKNWTGSYNLADEFNFWLDKNGDIIVAQQVTESMDASKVCLVIEAEEVSGSIGTSGSLAANLLFVDGSTEIVNVSKIATEGGDLLSVVDKLSSNATTAAKQITAKDALKKLVTDTKSSGALTKFYNYRSTSNGYELTELSSKVNSGRDWEDVVTTSTETEVTKTAQFAKGFGLTANNSTTFIIGKVDADSNTVNYTVAKGFSNIHEMDASMITGIAVNADPSNPSKVSTVAKYVYLETGSFKDDAPDGYIFITGKGWEADPDLYEDDVYVVNIVDTDGTTSTMRVDRALKDAVNSDSTKLNGTANTIFKFWAIKQIDENRMVSALGDKDGLEAAMVDVEAMGDGVINLAGNKAYSYDSATKFIYVDMVWADDTDDAANKIGVREPSKDNWVLSGSGSFDPEGFFNEADVDNSGANSDDVTQQNPNGATYISVQASVIERVSDTSYADYVYVLRYLW